MVAGHEYSWYLVISPLMTFAYEESRFCRLFSSAQDDREREKLSIRYMCAQYRCTDVEEEECVVQDSTVFLPESERLEVG